MNDLGRAARDVVAAYLDGRASLDDLLDWLSESEHVGAMYLPGNSEVLRLTEVVWLLVSEFHRGHRDEDELRAELRREFERSRLAREVRP